VYKKSKIRLRGFEQELAALTPGARLAVMLNPDYFDPSLPRTAVQLIACEFRFQQAHDAGDSAPFHADLGVEKLARLIEGARESR
jgi:tryptophanase